MPRNIKKVEQSITDISMIGKIGLNAIKLKSLKNGGIIYGRVPAFYQRCGS